MSTLRIILGLFAFVLGFVWAAQKPNSAANEIIRRVFYGYTLAWIGSATLLEVFAATTSDNKDLLQMLFAVLLFFVGVVAAMIGFTKHGNASVIDVGSFLLVYLLLYFTEQLPHTERLNFEMLALPAGALMWTFITLTVR